MDIINNYKFILFANYSANTLGQIRSLGEQGIRPIAVLVNKNSFRVDKSRYLERVYDVSDIESGLRLIIDTFGHEQLPPFIYTDSDAVMGLLDRHYQELRGRFIFWNAGGQGRLTRYMNKFEQIRLAEECGLKVPRTEVVTVGQLPTTLSYPIFTKAVDSLNQWWKGQAHICRNEAELLAVYERLKDVKELLLQEYIEKQNEVPYEGLSISEAGGGIITRLLVKSVNYRFTADSFGIYRHLEPFSDPTLEAKVQRFIETIGYTGVFEVEFIIDKQGTPYFLEANFRVTQYNGAYTLFGVNLPYLWAKSILDGHLALSEINYAKKRPFNVMSEFEDFRISCLHGNVSFRQWLKEFHQADSFQYYDKRDMKPFLWSIGSKIGQAFQ